MRQLRLRAVFMRGGTSKAIVFRQADLPADRACWDPLFREALGSPDPNGRQLDGMGGGVSSLSKICVVGPPSRPDADIDFTFVQVAVRDGTVDYAGNCGNMSSAMGPFAIDEGLIERPAGPEAVVRIHNTNTRKIIVASFAMDGVYAAVDGDLAIDGVAGTGAPIRLDFLAPGGAKTGKLLPTGNVRDTLSVPGHGEVPATLIDAANPAIVLAAASLNLGGTELPDRIERDPELLDKLEAIRLTGSVAMGIAPDRAAAARIPSIPRVALVSAPAPATTLSGRMLDPGDVDLQVRMMSTGQPHRAVPLTGALCLAVACRIPGSIPHRLCASTAISGNIRLGHPSGVIIVGAELRHDDGVFEVLRASVYRTARRLFEGQVLVRASARRSPVAPATP